MCFGDEGGVVVVVLGEGREDTSAAYHFPLLCLNAEQCSEKCSSADNSVKFILFCLFQENLCCTQTCFCLMILVCVHSLRYGRLEHECSTLLGRSHHHAHLHYHDALHSKGWGKHSGKTDFIHTCQDPDCCYLTIWLSLSFFFCLNCLIIWG